MNVYTSPVGSMRTNCYFLVSGDEKNTLIIDPGDDGQYLIEKIQSMQITPSAILATHGHFDHIMAAYELQLTYSIPFYIHASDEFLVRRMRETARHFLGVKDIDPPPSITAYIPTGEPIYFDDEELSVIPTPGHTPGSVSLYSKKHACCFVGDTVFKDGGIGRTDFAYADKTKIITSINTIYSLPDETILYPGHGEETNVSNERALRDNPSI
jgi:hydroxyacylglutathione hydrolase